MGAAVNQEQKKRQYPRYRIRLSTDVIAKSLGTPMPYKFQTENISIGGLFILGERHQYPFRNESILEIWLRLNESDKVFFNAKIVHGERSNGFGVKIVQISDEDEKRLHEFIESYIEKHPEAKMA